MSADLKAFLMSWLPGILTGGLVAVLSVRLALRRFRAERWWERKAQAYTELFSALYDVKRNAEIELMRLEEGGQYDNAFLKRIGDSAREAYTTIRRTAAMAPFLFNAEAAACLARLEAAFDDPKHNQDLREEIEQDLAATTKALGELRSIAKRDLSLK